MSTTDQTLRAQLSTHLLQSGAYDRINSLLRTRLEECGWSSEMRGLAREQARAQGQGGQVKFEQLLAAIEQKGIESVPDTIKIEILGMLREVLEEVVELP
ncbi:SAGA histone acetylase and TREX-2 complexes component [Saitoella coloradoensis]